MNDESPAATHRALDAAERGAATMAEVGMPRMPARVMMALVAAPAGGSTAAEIAHRLGVSAAAVSTALKYLQQMRFTQRLAKPGDRRDRYELVHDAFYGSTLSIAPVYDRLAGIVEEIADAHAEDPPAQARARELSDFFRFLATRLPELIDEWHALRSRNT